MPMEAVEQFRVEYACHYSLRDCALMLGEIDLGSIIVIWFTPESIMKKLQEDIPLQLLKVHSVVSLKISGVTVYPTPQKPAAVEISDQGVSADGAAPSQAKLGESSLSPHEDYPFIENPSEDFYCPVTKGLLLQPHLTSCCGHHLSVESVVKIQGDNKPCPMCKDLEWRTMLDRKFQRELMEMSIFCTNKENGCWWKGKLLGFREHSNSCQIRCFGGRTKLHDAAEKGDLEEIQRLLYTSVNINSRTEDDGDTAILLASAKGHVEVVCLLLQAKDIVYNIPDKGCRTPLYWASKSGHTEVVELLLRTSSKDVQIYDEDGFSPVYVASENGHKNVLDVLIRVGASVDQETKREPCNVPLGIASQNGHVEVVERLLAAIATNHPNQEDTKQLINHQNKSGETPMYLASWKGHSTIVRLLIGKGANISICKKGGVRPLYIASQEGHTSVVNELVKEGADVNQSVTAEPYSNPLGVAAEEGHIETVKRLLKAGANVNHQNKIGCTALFSAGWQGHLQVVKLLIAAGAIDIPTTHGDTARSIAREKGHNDVLQYLLQLEDENQGRRGVSGRLGHIIKMCF